MGSAAFSGGRFLDEVFVVTKFEMNNEWGSLNWGKIIKQQRIVVGV